MADLADLKIRLGVCQFCIMICRTLCVLLLFALPVMLFPTASHCSVYREGSAAESVDFLVPSPVASLAAIRFILC